MRIDVGDLQFDFISSTLVKVSWTGTLAKVVWVFINGIFYQGPVTFSGTSRYVDVPFEGVTNIEIHEVDGTETPTSIEELNEDKPWLYWGPVSTADKYRIYYRLAGETVDERLANIKHETSKTYYNKQVGRNLDRESGVFYWFRIEAVKSNQKKSTTERFPQFLRGLPTKPESIAFTQVGNKFVLTIET